MLLSIVAPVYNEEELIGEFVDRTLRAVRAAGIFDFELILVNDGSRDRSGQILLEKATIEAPSVKVVELSRNYGQQAAFHAGLSASQGDFVVTLDSDLQDPPEVIPRLLAAMGDEFDVTYARRTQPDGGNWGASGHTGLKSLGAYIYHLAVSRRRTTPMPRNVGEYRCMRRAIVNHLLQFPEYLIFLPGLVAHIGFTVGSVDYVRQRRGNQKQSSVWSLTKRALDAMTTFTALPLNLILGISCSVWLFPLLMATVLAVRAARSGTLPSATTIGWLAALIAWCVVVTMLGILAHYVGRIFFEVKSRPRYFVKRTIGGVRTTCGT